MMHKLAYRAFGQKRLLLLTIAGLVCATVFLIFGCGKKASPVVPGQIRMAAVADLEGALDQTTMTLTWTHFTENSRVKNYIVLRAQTDLSRLEACAGCPMVFQKVGIQAVERRLANKAHKLTFSLNLPKGFRYTFSVRPSQSSGAQGPDSNLVEVILPK